MCHFLLLPEKGQELVEKLLHNNKSLKLHLVIALICTITHSITLFPQDQPIHTYFVPCTFNMFQKHLLKARDMLQVLIFFPAPCTYVKP